jgi:outer membrane protein TolC
LIAVILFSVRNYSSAQTTILTLEESISEGIKNSKELKTAESRIISNKAKVSEVKSQFLPQLKFNAGYTRLSNVDPYLIIIPFSAAPLQLSEILLNNYNFRLTLQQQVFTGFKLSSLKQSAEYTTSSSETDYDNEMNKVAESVQISFWNYYKSKLIKNLAEENLKQTEEHIVKTKNLMMNGLATTSDLLKLEVQNSNAKLYLLEAENNSELARVAFNKSIGYPLDQKTDVKSETPEISDSDFILKDLTSEALNNRGEIKSMDFKLKSISENIKSVKSPFYPSVYLGANYYYSNPNLRIQPPVDKFDATWDASVTLSWDVWNWGYTSAQVTQAEQTLNQSKTNLAQLNESIEYEVNQNYLNIKYLKEKIEVSKKTIEQAEESYRVTMEKYNVQLATGTDIVDAETSLYQAKTGYTNALIDYRIAFVKLYRSVGRKLY